MDVSVVIPTLNSGATLGQCLQSLRRQTIPPEEIVVVDGGSEDNTLALASEFGASTLRSGLERASARREGVSVARGPGILFLDSDQVAAPDLLEDCQMRLTTEEFDMVKIHEDDVCGGFWAACRRLDRALSTCDSLSYPRFFRRASYLKAGGHRPGLERFMEDRDLYNRALRAGLRYTWSLSKISNLLGTLNPLQLGTKGAKAAIDSRAYYHHEVGSNERLSMVVRPRLENLLKPSTFGSASLRAIVSLPLYELAVYGPRLLSALAGSALRPNPRTSTAARPIDSPPDL